MKKSFQIFAVVLALLLLAGTLAFSVVTMLSVRAMAQEQANVLERLEELENPEDPGSEEHASSEDDVVIAQEYTIRSTLAISDAYLSGDSSQLSDKDKETLSMASEILDGIITDGMTPYEKELAVYEWMVANLAYDSGSLIVIPETDQDSDNPYGVLKYHNAVCVGYATTFRLFMQMLEIPCKVVHNSELFHTWDLVQLDGHWYHVDVYSDVGVSGHASLNLPDNVRMQQQSWDTDFFPAADSLEYNYCWRNHVDVDDVYGVPAAVRQAMDEGTDGFALSFPADTGDADAQLAQQMLNALDNALMNNPTEDLPSSIREQNWLMDDNGNYCVLVSFNYSSDKPDVPEDPEALEKAEESLQNAFGDLFDVTMAGGYDPPYYVSDIDYTADNGEAVIARGVARG
ncbi:MAG: transglutaminase domain-containing protein [Oscillospiraceae bacterium]|nr:transglutaminase domain-containing protein [Oscillospiraceae bacterium]